MTEDDAEKATQYLVDTAYPYGKARARVALAEASLRRVKSLAMKASGETAVSAQEREAYASDQYQAALDELFIATTEAEMMRAAREAAVVRVDFWRSVNARQRGA
jgi:hypothetical protein